MLSPVHIDLIVISVCTRHNLIIWPLRWQKAVHFHSMVYLLFFFLEETVFSLKGSFEHFNLNQIKSNLYRVLPSTSSIPESARRFYPNPKVIQDHDCGNFQLLQLSYFILEGNKSSLLHGFKEITPSYPLFK